MPDFIGVPETSAFAQKQACVPGVRKEKRGRRPIKRPTKWEAHRGWGGRLQQRAAFGRRLDDRGNARSFLKRRSGGEHSSGREKISG